jgi:hypothetical protein
VNALASAFSIVDEILGNFTAGEYYYYSESSTDVADEETNVADSCISALFVQYRLIPRWSIRAEIV